MNTTSQIASMVQKARTAQRIFETFSQRRIDAIVRAIETGEDANG